MFFLKDQSHSAKGAERVAAEPDNGIQDEGQRVSEGYQNHVIQELHYRIAREVTVDTIDCDPTGSLAFKYLRIDALISSSFIQTDYYLFEPKVKKILESTSDLISGIYEGGFKIWECTYYLIEFLKQRNIYRDMNSGKRILDLGCGSGLLGLLALSQGAAVDFHDYNSDVINFLTIPNVILNKNDESAPNCRFFSGSWKSFNSTLVDSSDLSTFQYDFILSSETVYNLESLPDLCLLIKTCLKSSGIMFLAAKTCYFGVGGGTKAFLLEIEKEPLLKAEIIDTYRIGIQREIISIKFQV